MLKRTLIVIAVALGIGCKDTYDKRGHNPLSKAHYYEEKAVMFTIDYHKKHGSYPSYYTRELYYKHKDDKDFVDSLIYKTPDIESFRGEGYSEDTIHRCIYDSCPHIIKESGIGVAFSAKSGRALKWEDLKDSLSFFEVPRKGGGIITKWNDDFQKIGPIDTGVPEWATVAGTGTVQPIKDTVLPKRGCTITKWTDPSKVERGRQFYIIDSLGNIIEDTVGSFNFVEPTPMEKILGTRESYILKLDSSGAPKWIKKDSLP